MNDNRRENGASGGATSGQIDYTKYPEGFNALLKHLDFLPDDEKVRRRFLMGLMETLGRR